MERHSFDEGRRPFKGLHDSSNEARMYPMDTRGRLNAAPWAVSMALGLTLIRADVPTGPSSGGISNGSIQPVTVGETTPNSALAAALLAAVRSAHFEEVVDFGAGNEDHDAEPGSVRRIAHVPNVDVAVIQLDHQGKAVAWANVLLSRDYPTGYVVPATLDAGASTVRFLRWDIDRWNGGSYAPGNSTPRERKGWTNDPPLRAEDDLIPGREMMSTCFMSPYPASLFKLLVALQTLRSGSRIPSLAMDQPQTFHSAGAPAETHPVGVWLERMITVSDNRATQVLLKLLHQEDQLSVLHQDLRRWGLATLQINGTRPSDGGGWQTDRIHMTAFDSARLLWLIDGGPGILWRTPEGTAVTTDVLDNKARTRLLQLLAEQGLNEALSTSNLAGAPHVVPGLPTAVPMRWVDPATGTVTVDGIRYGMDVREANKRAEVGFAHKTGLTYNYASDAGIVRSLPGQPFRHYVIAFFSNLGYRYSDPVFANRPRGPYMNPVTPISYTQRIPALARRIDQSLIELSKTHPSSPP